MADNPKPACCTVYLYPEGIAAKTLVNIKAEIKTAGARHLASNLLFQESDLSFRDLLAQLRSQREDLSCFFILDQTSAHKGAVQCVETRQHKGVKGFRYLYSSAACTRKMYVRASSAISLDVHLAIGVLSWEDMHEGMQRDAVIEF